MVVLVGGASEHALDLLAGLDCEDVLEVEDGLLPVGVLLVSAIFRMPMLITNLGVRSGAELYWLVALGESNIEPAQESVNVCELVPSG